MGGNGVRGNGVSHHSLAGQLTLVHDPLSVMTAYESDIEIKEEMGSKKKWGQPLFFGRAAHSSTRSPVSDDSL